MSNFWANKRVFITGHTGFKGSWLSLCLQRLGAKVYGFALKPDGEQHLYGLAAVNNGMKSEYGDVRDFDQLLAAIRFSKAEIVFHLAAQALVRQSYADPLTTYSTNVLGTVHLLEAVRRSGDVVAVVNVTTDKCYDNQDWIWPYREDDRLGGYDPYSNSKACSELITAAFRQSYFSNSAANERPIFIATARAGNVIGGGDFARDRLVPDSLAAFELKRPVKLRNHNAIRPWQHVLEPISAYMRLAQSLHEHGNAYAQAWNFGPKVDEAKNVQWVVSRLAELWGEEASWCIDDSEDHPHESNRLKLDISKAEFVLKWRPKLSLEDALLLTVQWTKSRLVGENARDLCIKQIDHFFKDCVS